MLLVKDVILTLSLLSTAVLAGCGGGTPIADNEIPALGAATSSEVPTADTNDSPIVSANSQLQELASGSGSDINETAAVSALESQLEQEANVTDETDALTGTQLPIATTDNAESEENNAASLSQAEQESIPTAEPDNPETSQPAVAQSSIVDTPEPEPTQPEPTEPEPTEPEPTEPEPTEPEPTEPEPTQPEPTQPESSSSANNESLSGQCLGFQNESLSFGEVTNSTWRSWTSPLNFHYSESPQFLQFVGDSDAAYVQQKFVPASNGSARVLANAYLPSERTYRLTQSIFFESGFDWGGTEEGGKLGFGFSGGSAPSGGLLQTDGFSARFMWRGNKDGTAKLVLYSYAADRSQNLPYGDDYPLSGFDVPVGEWIDLTMEVTVNSTTSASDGSIRVWANGVLRLERDNIQWQSTGSDPAVQALSYASFYGGNSSAWAPGHTTYVRFKNVCWAPVTEGNSAIDPYETNDVNAERLDGQTLDKQIYSDYIESEQLTLSPRGKLLSVYRQLELLLPTENYDLDVGLSSTLVAISEALVADNWIDNYTLHANGASRSEIVKAQGLITMLSEQDSYSEFITSQLFQAQDTLGETLSEFGD